MPNFEQWLADAAEIAFDPTTAQLVKDVATGEGGAQKVYKGGQDILTIFGHLLAGQAAAPPVA